MKIHPSAIVDPGARLGDEVEIGPYASVGAAVEIGPATIVQAHAVIEGAVRIGSANRIGPGAIIGGWPQDLNFKPGTRSSVEIGDRNVIRENATIHRGTAADSATRLGDDNFLMAGAHLGHNCIIGSKVIIANNCLLGGYVTVEDAAFLGGGCVFHQFMRVGRLAITQGLSAFSKDIPPFCLAAERNLVFGLNVIGLRRAGFSAAERAEVKRAFRLLYESGLNVTQALAKADEEEWPAPAQAFFDFVSESKRRGICALRRGREEAESGSDL
ncbi:MAG TPA: acyl-ACP--UDP-N-acetylglucosamine O-acyltransferase [Chthoniobacterales bacterium]|nr:acyl-ACP--UDP-N-acetylglucosamine O-acyltransferase [Chthoniobacterales bacterium]